MKRITITLLFVVGSILGDVIHDARRLAVNDSVPFAIKLLTDSLKNETQDARRYMLWLETGDILLQYAKLYKDAGEVYESMIKYYKDKPNYLKELYYRAGVAFELAEDFKKAAGYYERQVVDFPKSQFHEDALSAIERCFKKNYQEVVAHIDGYPITQLEFDERIQRMPEFKRKEYESYKKKRELLEDMIFDRLLFLEAKRKVAPAESIEVECMKSEIVKIKIPRYSKEIDIRERLKKAEDNILFRRLYDTEITSKVSITDKEVKDYYKKHKEEFKIPKRYTYREILIKDSLKVDSALAMLDSIPFDSVAKLYSVSYTRKQGGLVRERWETNIPESIKKVITGLKKGKISKPFKTANGYLILKLEEVLKPTYKKFERVKTIIERKLKTQKTEKRYREVVEEYRKSVPVDTTPRKDTIGIVNGYVILKKEFDKKLEEMPLDIRERYKTGEGKSKIIENLIFTRILRYQVANKKVYLSDPIQQQLYNTRKKMLVDYLLDEEVTKKAVVTEDEIKNYYQKHKKEFYVPAKIKLREILLTSKDTAQKVYELLKKGLPFDSLAREYSEATSAKKGGYVGYLTKNDRDKYPYISKAFKIKEGKFSKPIKTEDGYYILFVESKKKGYQRTLDQAKSEIEFKLKKEKRNSLEAALKGRLFSSADIKIYLEEKKG